jgi:hypothetical protein
MSEQMTLEQFKAILASHDWFYYMSDDHGVWMRGERASAEVMAIAKAGPSEFRQAYNAEHAKHFHTESFSNWTNPFPDDL